MRDSGTTSFSGSIGNPGISANATLNLAKIGGSTQVLNSAMNVTKSTAVAREAAEIPSLLADAWALAQSAPAGPTWVEIPEDVLLEATHVPPVTSVVTHIAERPATDETPGSCATGRLANRRHRRRAS